MTTSTSEKAKQFTLADSPVPSVERAPEPTSETATRPRAFLYMPVRAKFLLATGLSAIWFSISLLLAKPWLEELSAVTGTIPAFLIILFIALIPGFLNAHIVASLVLDSPPPLPLDINYPAATILMAAYNEADNVRETFRGIAEQEYPAPIEVIVVDDGSTDGTVEILSSLKLPNLKIIRARHGGKARALNEGLKQVSNAIVVAIDADTFLHPQALKRIVARLVTDPQNTAAVAGCVLVKNSRETFMARMQEWDYFTGIASAKRQQSLYQGTLVAQGAFSAFRTAAVRHVQGWSPVIGEDIVLTWALLKDGWRIGFEASAIGFTCAPTDFKSFFRQRRRWARGMIEGLKQYGSLAWKNSRLSSFFIGIDFVIPVVDLFYTFVFLPGVILALTGRFYIAGPQTLILLPMALAIVTVMYRKQKAVFTALNLKVRQNFAGFVVYILVYQILMSPICVVGYIQELCGTVKRW
jgi:biofilm PGA synthesis N-glycosyltransferase PgaC